MLILTRRGRLYVAGISSTQAGMTSRRTVGHRGLVAAVFSASLLFVAGITSATSLTKTQTASVPHTDAVTGIFTILDSVPLVAIGDIHAVAEEGAFYQKLVRHPQFGSKVDDLILELGNELYQDVADRYVSGKTVPVDSLRMIWENTTQGPLLTATAPMYTSLFDAVREVNSRQQPERRVRILLGDPAVEWKTVTREQLWAIHAKRGDRMRELARDSVLAKGRRGIIIAGFRHLNRQPLPDRSTDGKWGDLSSKIFVIRPHIGFGGSTARYEPMIDSLPAGSLIRLRDTFLGDLESDSVDQATPASGAEAESKPPPPPPHGLQSANAGLKLRDVSDGYLYLGPFRAFTVSRPDVERIRGDASRLRDLQQRSCVMMGRPVDTTRLYRTPQSNLVFPAGRRPSVIDYQSSEPPPSSPPPLPPNVPEPCGSLLKGR